MTAVPSATAAPEAPRPVFPMLGGRAVVLGASLAGLLAARVLSERFFDVVLLERDQLPEGTAPRKGTPHAAHPHGLLARGREVLEQLFPGFTQALQAQGAELGDLQRDVAFTANGECFARAFSGQPGLAVSRLALEAEVRRRVLARPGVSVRAGVDVIAPLLDGAQRRVEGVRYAVRATPPRAAFDDADAEAARGQTLVADLVVDCTGRGSRLPSWLRDWGYAAVPEEQVDVGISYTSAYFRREGELALARGANDATAPDAAAIGVVAVFGAATAQQPRPNVLIAQEPGTDGVPRWVLGVGSYTGDHPPPTLQGLRERCQQSGTPEMVRIAHEGTPIGEVARYHFPASQRRRYDRLQRFPAGMLAMGDALASFNPIYGQGMTVAACEALALDEALRGGLDNLAPRFFRAAAELIDTPWQMAVGGDLAIPAVPGPRPLPVRLTNAYIGRLYRAAPHDATVAHAFLRVVHMLDQPAKLFTPAMLWRVLVRPLLGRAPATAPRDSPAPRSDSATAPRGAFHRS